jgi:hypothetical protein
MAYATPTVTQIASAISTTVLAAMKTNGVTLRSLPYLSDQVPVPVLLPAIETVTYHEAFGGGNVGHTFTLHLIVGRVNIRTSMAALEGFMSYSGPSSIRAALETVDGAGSRTLGGVVQDCVVVKAGPPVSLGIGNPPVEYVSVQFTAEIIA